MNETKWTPGPWAAFIDDTRGQWTGWPLSIGPVNDDDKSVVRPGGQWPYEWDAAMSQREAVANAHLIAAAPELYEALADAEAWLRNHAGLPEGMPVMRNAVSALAKARGEA